MPFVMRWMWRLQSMPAGPLRERLEEFSEREGFRARDLLVWPTGGNILNDRQLFPKIELRHADSWPHANAPGSESSSV